MTFTERFTHRKAQAILMLGALVCFILSLIGVTLNSEGMIALMCLSGIVTNVALFASVMMAAFVRR